MDEQTLEQFLAEERTRLDAFEAWWKEKRAVEPEHFPEKLSSGDWCEQYTLFDMG